jgi:chromate transporter
MIAPPRRANDAFSIGRLLFGDSRHHRAAATLLRDNGGSQVSDLVLADAERATPSRLDLFLTFAKIGLCGFGGVGPWARRIIVEEKTWLDEREYAEILGLCQILPGPNVGNVAVCIGDRFHGLLGSVLALVGLLSCPLAILVGLVTLYDQVGQVPVIHAAIGGVAAAAAGLFIGTALRMANRLKLSGIPLLILGCAFIAASLLHWSLMAVIAVLAPISIVWAWRAQA